jgi:hypothetical protein
VFEAAATATSSGAAGSAAGGGGEAAPADDAIGRMADHVNALFYFTFSRN